MPIPIEKIQVVEDEMERQHYGKDDHDGKDDDDDEHNNRHRHAMTPPEQDFSYLKNSANGKRSVHYDIEQLNHYEDRPLRTTNDNEPPLESVLRRRFIAHWGLPGLWRDHFVWEETAKVNIRIIPRKKPSEKVMTFTLFIDAWYQPGWTHHWFIDNKRFPSRLKYPFLICFYCNRMVGRQSFSPAKTPSTGQFSARMSDLHCIDSQWNREYLDAFNRSTMCCSDVYALYDR